MKQLGGRARAAGSTCDICDEVLLMCDHVAEEHLEASLVHLLQVGQEGFVLVPQDIVCPKITMHQAIAVQHSRCLDDSMCRSSQITRHPSAADSRSAEALGTEVHKHF